jgi:hypothetical protein
MTTPLNTIMSLIPHLTADQLQTIEAYTAWFYRQNLATQIAALPNTSLSGVGLYVNMVAAPQQFIPVPPPPVLENAVPAPFLPDLPPSPEKQAQDLLPPLSCSQHSRHSRHPQLKSPSPEEPCECFNCSSTQDCNEEVKCPGCLNGEWGQRAHTGPDGCCNYEDDREEDDHRSGGCRSGYTW